MTVPGINERGAAGRNAEALGSGRETGLAWPVSPRAGQRCDARGASVPAYAPPFVTGDRPPPPKSRVLPAPGCPLADNDIINTFVTL